MSFKPNEQMRAVAKRALEWRKKYGRGGTAVGVARARDIANGSELSASTVKRMHSFFSRHSNNKAKHYSKKMPDGGPTAWRIAWDLWGGSSGRRWARGKVASMDNDRALTGSVEKGLKAKMEKHNESVNAPHKKATMSMLRKVFERGVGAYKTNPGSVRPSVKSPEQWAYARVNSFMYALKNERFRGGKHDTDLFPSGHKLKSKGDDRFEDINMERHIIDVQETDESIIIELAKMDEDRGMYDDDEDRAEEIVEEERAEEEVETRDVEVVQRSHSLDARMLDDDKRTVRMSISSETGVERSFGMEVLEHSKEAVDLSFLASGRANLLLDHDPRNVIGVIEDVHLDEDTRRLRAKVRFGKSELASSVYEDVKDGIRSSISVGYQIDRLERRDEKTYVAKRWKPVEASIVAIPADMSEIGIGRSAQVSNEVAESVTTESAEVEAATTETRQIEVMTMEENVIDVEAVAAEARQAAQKNAAAIIELGARHNKSDLAREAIAQGSSIEEFRGQLLDVIGSNEALDNQEIGLSKKEAKRFSILRAVRALANPHDRRSQEEAKFEFECSEAASKQYGREAEGIMLPTDVLRTWGQRDLNSADEADLFGEDYRGGDFIDVLRNASSVMSAGARTLNGLSGDVRIPKKLTAAAAGWIASEGGASSESEMTVGNISMVPRTLGAHTDATRQLLIQSSMDVENLIRDDLAQAIALAIDLAALEGTGSSGQPTGILNTTGVNTVTNFAAANPTFAEVVTLETAVANDNALSGNLAYILPSAMYGALKTTEKATGTAQFVAEPGGTINGYRAIISNQGTAGNLYFGNFSDCLVGFFGGVDIKVDPYSLSTSGGVRIVALAMMDVAIRHAVSFAFGNDG